MPSSALDATNATSALIAPRPAVRSAPPPAPGNRFDDHLQKQQQTKSTDAKPADDRSPSKTKRSDAKQATDKKTDDASNAKPADPSDAAQSADAANKKTTKKDADASTGTQSDDAAAQADQADGAKNDADHSADAGQPAPTPPEEAAKTDDASEVKKPVVVKKKDTTEVSAAAVAAATQQDAAAQAAAAQAAQNPKTAAQDGAKPSDAQAAAQDQVAAVDAAQTKAAAKAPVATPAPSTSAPAADGKPHEPAVKPSKAKTDEAAVAATATTPDKDKPDTDAKTPAPAPAVALDPAASLQQQAPTKNTPAVAALPVATAAHAAAANDRQVAQNNIDRIVTSVRGELLTKGGSMQIRLDPPTLGTINVQVNVNDGVLTASLQTENDQATRLLSHNLTDLKSTLESAGVSVDRIQVKQAAPNDASSNQHHASDQDRQQQGADDHPARQEQQRREMLQRMWRKLAMGDDPLDLVA
ncbi:MAG: flagellar hook-length control protein FliK [Tepidisphaeraceae bacterium]